MTKFGSKIILIRFESYSCLIVIDLFRIVANCQYPERIHSSEVSHPPIIRSRFIVCKPGSDKNGDDGWMALNGKNRCRFLQYQNNRIILETCHVKTLNLVPGAIKYASIGELIDIHC